MIIKIKGLNEYGALRTFLFYYCGGKDQEKDESHFRCSIKITSVDTGGDDEAAYVKIKSFLSDAFAEMYRSLDGKTVDEDTLIKRYEYKRDDFRRDGLHFFYDEDLREFGYHSCVITMSEFYGGNHLHNQGDTSEIFTVKVHLTQVFTDLIMEIDECYEEEFDEKMEAV